MLTRGGNQRGGVLAKSVIEMTAITIATTITGTSSTMPTAVMTESIEKTRSMAMICTMAPTGLPELFFGPSSSSLCSTFLWISDLGWKDCRDATSA